MYTFSDDTGLVVHTEIIGNITQGNKREWAKYQKWLSEGNTTEPCEKEPTTEELLAGIAAERYAMQVADLDYYGLLIKMDQLSWTMLDSTMDKIRRGVASEIEWHCRNGYLILNADNIDEIELLGVQHIQSAFIWAKAEKDKLEASE